MHPRISFYEQDNPPFLYFEHFVAAPNDQLDAIEQAIIQLLARTDQSDEFRQHVVFGVSDWTNNWGGDNGNRAPSDPWGG
jgi:hypothetical protein